MRSVFTFLASGFGVGYTPYFPGTAGSILALIIYLILHRVFSSLGYLVFLSFFILGGVWVSQEAEKVFQKKDHSFIVIDEMAGMLLSLLFVPFKFRLILLAFILFRAIDISKPFKLEKLERLPGGWGIMADDLVSGGMTCVLVWLSRIMFKW